MSLVRELRNEASRLRSHDYSGEERGRAWRAATLLEQAADHIEELPFDATWAETSWRASDLTENFDMTAEEARAWLKKYEPGLLGTTVRAGNEYISNNCRAGMRH